MGLVPCSMRGYAGVTVVAGGFVLMVREPDHFSGKPHWTLPSGKIEPGERPQEAALRELMEEAGYSLGESELKLASIAVVERSDELLSKSWNYAATVAGTGTLTPDDPDGLITEARWIPRREAIGHMNVVTQAAKREPALRLLTTGDLGLSWTFELVDDRVTVPEFQWIDPTPMKDAGAADCSPPLMSETN